MPATRLLLIRHAEVETRYHKVFGGRIDMEISELGHRQAAALADFLRRKTVHAVYASPMKRVQQTLSPYLQSRPSQPIVLHGLREVDFGDWTGHRWEEVKDKFGFSAFEWLELLERGVIPNAEPVAAYRGRIEPCVREIVSRHQGQTAAVFCHGGVIRMILSILLELPLSRFGAFNFDYASVSEIELQPERMEVQLLNFTPWRDVAGHQLQ